MSSSTPIRTFLLAGILAWLGTAARAGITVRQNLGSGAASWPGASIISTTSAPNTQSAVGESFSTTTAIAQTFTLPAGSNYTLQTIDLYAGGGTGTSTSAPVTVNLYDLGAVAAPNPDNYPASANLLGGGSGVPDHLRAPGCRPAAARLHRRRSGHAGRRPHVCARTRGRQRHDPVALVSNHGRHLRGRRRLPGPRLDLRHERGGFLHGRLRDRDCQPDSHGELHRECRRHETEDRRLRRRRRVPQQRDRPADGRADGPPVRHERHPGRPHPAAGSHRPGRRQYQQHARCPEGPRARRADSCHAVDAPGGHEGQQRPDPRVAAAVPVRSLRRLFEQLRELHGRQQCSARGDFTPERGGLRPRLRRVRLDRGAVPHVLPGLTPAESPCR